jgi:hypothetical protein
MTVAGHSVCTYRLPDQVVSTGRTALTASKSPGLMQRINETIGAENFLTSTI